MRQNAQPRTTGQPPATERVETARPLQSCRQTLSCRENEREGKESSIIEDLFQLSDAVRYVAIYRDGTLRSKSKEGTAGASNSESDHYEELIVNPAILCLTQQRGDIDCGGLNYVLIRYGNFFQLVCPADWGHVSVCIEKTVDPVPIARKVQDYLR